MNSVNNNNSRLLITTICLYFLWTVLVVQAGINRNAITPRELLKKSSENQELIPPYAMHTESRVRYSSGQTGLLVYDQRWDGDRIDVAYKRYLVTRDQKRLEYDKRGIWTGKQFQWRQQYVPPGWQERDPVYAAGSIYNTRAKRLITAPQSGAFLSGILVGDSRHVSSVLEESDELILKEQMETVHDSLCYVIEGQTPNGYYKVWIDPAHGFNVRKAIIKKESNDLYFGESIGSGTAKEHVFVGCHIELDDVYIEKIGDYYVPVSGTFVNTLRYSDGKTKQTRWTSEISNIQFNPDFESIGAFVMDGIPEGTSINMEGMPGLRYVWSDAGFIVDIGLDIIDQIDDTIDVYQQREVSIQKGLVQTDNSDTNVGQTVEDSPSVLNESSQIDISEITNQRQSPLLRIICTIIIVTALLSICIMLIIRLLSDRRTS